MDVNGSARTRARGFVRLALLATVIASAIVGCRNGVKWLLGLPGAGSQGFFAYPYWLTKDNYFTSGFSRRGLSSTLFSMLDHASARTSTSIFSVICATFLALPLLLFMSRLHRKGGRDTYWLALVLLLSPQMFWAWGADIGRSDMLSCAFVAWALLATLHQRYILAALVLVLGSLNHEAALILGTPLCAAFWFVDWREGKASLPRAAGAVGVFALAMSMVFLLQHVFSASPQQIARAMTTGPQSDYPKGLRSGSVDPRLVASYMTVGGFRTLVASNCMMYSSPGAFILPLSCFATILLYIVIYSVTSRTGLTVFFVCCLLPMTFLSIIAIDYGRWLSFTVMNGWLATAALRIRESTRPPDGKWRLPVGALALLALLFLGNSDAFASGRRIHRLIDKTYGPMTDPASHLRTCDPQWSAIARGLIPK